MRYMDNWCENSLVKYSCQMIILAIVIIASVVNLSLNWDKKGIWLPLLCSSLGYIMANPSIKKKKMNKLLSLIFFDPSHPASFLGPQKLYEPAVKQDSTMTLNAMKSWLSGEETYTFHKPSRKKFKRNVVVDLMDMTKIAKYNNGYHYILLSIHIFYRYVWMVALRDESGNEVVHAFIKIFKERVPKFVHSDKGTEFLGHTVQNLFNPHLIRHFVTQYDVKANYAE